MICFWLNVGNLFEQVGPWHEITTFAWFKFMEDSETLFQPLQYGEVFKNGPSEICG